MRKESPIMEPAVLALEPRNDHPGKLKPALLGRPRVPVSLKVVMAVLAGTAVGLLAGRRDILPGLGTDTLGELGLLVIRMLKTLAVPLVFFAILDAFLRTHITAGLLDRRFTTEC